jgi:hypothetical protein
MSDYIIKRFREGNLLAEVEVKLIPDDGSWGPYLSLDDTRKLERVRTALKNADIATAAKDARIFEVTAVAAE